MPVISVIFTIISLYFIIEMESVRYIISFTIDTEIPLCCYPTPEQALTVCSSSEPADDTIFVTLYLLFTVCFLGNLIVDVILESGFFTTFFKDRNTA
jgi:hypothetical protein